MFVTNSLQQQKKGKEEEGSGKEFKNGKTSRIARCDHQLCSRIQMHHGCFQLPTRPKGIAACDHEPCDCIQAHHVKFIKARHQELPWDHQLCNNIQAHPSAGTHQSVLRCFPCYIPASLGQVGYNRLDPPPKSKKNTSIPMVHTHTHTCKDLLGSLL